jgi:phytanoyl-CoA hydroxylase
MITTTAPSPQQRASSGSTHAAMSAMESEHFRREGYLVLPRMFAESEVTAVTDAVSDIARAAFASGDHSAILEVEPELVDGAPVPRRIYDPFLQHQAFRAMATDSRLLDRIEALIGPDIALQHSKLNMKAARVGSVVEWHQDLSFFPHTNDHLITADNGCLQVVPRQHHRYFDHALPDGSFAGMIFEDLASYGAPISLAAPAGSVILMHCLTPHRSLPNRSRAGRRTLIYEYRAADAFPIYYGQAVVVSEAKARQVRGSPAAVARFGGPPPRIPRCDAAVKSLYEFQRSARAIVGADGRVRDDATNGSEDRSTA